MRLTRAAENAVHAMVQVATAPERLCLASDVAARLKTDPAYLAKIMQQLARAGLLISRQGRGGGFLAALPPRQVTLRMIVEAIEGETAFNECLLQSGRCVNSRRCRLHRALSQAQGQFLKVFERWTLSDLMEEAGGGRVVRGGGCSGRNQALR